MPTVSIFIATLIWGASYLFIKLALQELTPLVFVFYRFAMATTIMVASVLLLRLPFKRQDVVRGSKLGGLLAGVMCFQTIGLATIPAPLAAFLIGFSTVLILVIKFIAQKKWPCWADVLASFTCLAGLGLVTQHHGLVWQPGVGYTLLAALCIALYTYSLSVDVKQSSPWVLTCVQMAVITLIACSVLLLSGQGLVLPTQTATWGALLFCACFCSCVAFGLQAYSQRYLSPFVVGMIVLLEPVFATLFDCFVCGGQLSGQFCLGVGMILGAITYINLHSTSGT